MATTEEEQLRLKSRSLFHRIGAWGTLNALRQNLAVGRAEVVGKYGESLDDTTKAMLEDVPFGSVVNVSAPQIQRNGLSSAVKLAGVGLLAAAAGLGGYMLANQKSATPPPVDAVLEWEISNGGGSQNAGAGDSGASRHDIEIEAATVRRNDD